MKIIITEGKVEILKELIKTRGIKEAISVIGGLSNLAKVLGYDTVPEYIYQYLTENLYPDYNWVGSDYYKEEVERFGSIQFYINDKLSFDYTKYENDYKKLDIYPWLYNELEDIFEVNGVDIFGWKGVIKKWFTDNTGLKVDRII